MTTRTQRRQLERMAMADCCAAVIGELRRSIHQNPATLQMV